MKIYQEVVLPGTGFFCKGQMQLKAAGNLL